MPGYSKEWMSKPAIPMAVTGYTGNIASLKPQVGSVFGQGQVAVEPLDTFFHEGGAHPTPAALTASFGAAQAAHLRRAAMAAHRTPGYAGHLSGQQHACGKSRSAVCLGEAGPTHLPNLGEGAPGLTDRDQLIVCRNLLRGVTNPRELPTRTKHGYTGHLPGRHESTNFGKSYMQGATELLQYSGTPPAGGIGDPGRPFIADNHIEPRLAFPEGHQGRPQRSQHCISGYAGFRPRTTPLPGMR